MTTPTPAQLAAAGLIAVTTYEEIEAAYANGQGPLRSYNAAHEDFPPVQQGYMSKPKVTPPVTTFAAVQTGPNEVTVDWSGFSPTAIARDGTDTNGGGPWNTGTLTDQPTSGKFKFEYLVPGDTYLFTITGANVSMTATVKMPAPSTTFPTLGINGSTDAASLAQMQSLGVKLVRVQVTWNYYDEWDAMNGAPFYNTDGSFNASIAEQANAIKTLCASYGITVLFLIDGFISSVAPPAGAGNYTAPFPYTPAAYAEACAWFCSQVKGAHIEGPNEPDGYANWNGSVPFLASDYAIAMPLVYAQCKAAEPTCVVHIAPVSGVNGSALTWRQALLKALPSFAEYIDFDGWHFYVWPRNAPPSTQAGLTATFITAAGITKSSWITEGGIPSLTTNSANQYPEMTPASQATFLPELIQLVVGIALIEAFFIYCLQDYGSGSSAGYWGLVDRPPPSGPDADSNPKPSFAAVQALIATLTQLGAS